ncbi:hypothetical protein [Hymenobacter weizhouensis]|uniref:hypothetical protein n=1 Tax=Hymenobacter sp. YIM 151500-1 TaxID=2987689 RepID=UPI0022279119|nr:hypothetical protein [Hymenobacter sp. YIM 151500-1]UYZ65089.1 hypothetical protein OIS53_09595 [Hymenobacter sp. YIM 151500-1]
MPQSLFSTSSFDLAQASDWTRRFRAQSDHDVKGHVFSRADLEAVLAQPGAEGIRFYYGRDEQNQPRLVMVGVDGTDNDILPAPTVSAASMALVPTLGFQSLQDDSQDPGGIVGPGKTCPPFCSSDNVLNS